MIAEVDISDPAAITISRTMAFDGSYVEARLTGSTARLVSSDYPDRRGRAPPGAAALWCRA